MIKADVRLVHCRDVFTARMINLTIALNVILLLIGKKTLSIKHVYAKEVTLNNTTNAFRAISRDAMTVPNLESVIHAWKIAISSQILKTINVCANRTTIHLKENKNARIVVISKVA